MEGRSAKEIRSGSARALLIVDLQNDFLPGGALPVPMGDKVVPELNRYISAFRRSGARIVATMDWHPADHCSFRERGGPWPPHCVRRTWGARICKDLKLPRDALIVKKATKPDEEAYSGFQGTGLGPRLKEMGIREIFVGGVATDYCVKNTVLDALKEGFEVYVLQDAIKGIDAKPGDVERAKEEMRAAGAKFLTSADLLLPYS